MKSLELGSHLATEFCIEVGKRLVHEEDLRLGSQCPCDGDSLLLTSGELCRVTTNELLDPEHLQHLLDTLLDVVLLPFEVLESESDVLVDRHVRPQGIVLEQKSDVSLGRRDVDSRLRVEDDLVPYCDPSLGGSLETRDHSQRGGLTAAGRAEQCDEVMLVDVKIQIIDGDEFLKTFGNVFQSDFRHINLLRPCLCLLP